MQGEFLKRLLDVIGSSVALGLTAPVMLGVAAAVRATMGGPVFFRQRRPGLHGELFELVKFRTMRLATPGEDPLRTDAVRLTPLGSFLRSTSLDELPTFLNVLRGDMSLVGPRPLLPQYLARYSPTQARRHEVRPGITGLAQVKGRNALSWEDKFALDVWYVDHRSFALDLKILMMTALRIVQRNGIGHGAQPTMPEFMGSGHVSAHGEPADSSW
jgi:sugar transferase EpsL